MFSRKAEFAECTVDFQAAAVTSLQICGVELLAAQTPLFRIGLRDRSGEAMEYSAYDAKSCMEIADGAVYSGFEEDLSVQLRVDGDAFAEWHLTVENRTDRLIEWVEFPNLILKPLRKNGGNASILFPYNEGALIDDVTPRERISLRHQDPEYPSKGAFAVFPNMICSQFMCYLMDGFGLYMGAQDPKRGVKAIDYYPCDGGIATQFRMYCGGDYGGSYECPFPMVWKAFEGDWQMGAELYRQWFEQHLPSGLKKAAENPQLPEWYADSPLVVTYPVRGEHDMDDMQPNALFPYGNALPIIDELAEKTGNRLLVLLMHWEGTAPWAPPYVWPPYGGEAMFTDFAHALHQRNHLLGVYCSGFGWTLKSNLIDSYHNEAIYEEDQLDEAMCAGPDGRVQLSRICIAQRAGYDLCVKSEKGRKILDEAYDPLFHSSVDYAQILDQNHGGGQYFCYSRDHGHPPAPGDWMTESMRDLLDGWNRTAGTKLLGCESAAAEAFLPNLLFSDNRYELNWRIGEPVPMYAYIYHEYLRNFMGNQVSCGLSSREDTLRLRMAYSFTAGDCMTLVLMPDGRLSPNWGCRDFSVVPDRELALTFAANMHRLYETQAKPYLYAGRMIPAVAYDCASDLYHAEKERPIWIRRVLSTAWTDGCTQVQLFVNHTAQPEPITVNGKTVTVPALDGILLPINS